ncbi:MAG TPA: hypothetical protein VF137_08620 [Candidatus Dormibacteraeota bacterium]
MEGRHVAAISAAIATGIVVLAAAELAALVLYRRLLNGSPIAIAVLVVVFTVIGGYAAWLVAVVVFSAVRSAGEEAASTPD